jgi:hypothetical protein
VLFSPLTIQTGLDLSAHTQREPPADGATSNNNNRLLATIEAAAKKERGGIYIYVHVH